ncbi:hypothetical protein D9M70_523080 [compost metagenome]
MDPPTSVLPDPKGSLRPGKAGIAAAARCRDRCQHAAALGIDLLDAVLGDLEQMLAVKGGTGMRRDIDRAHRVPAFRIEGIDLVAGGKPDVPTVEGDAMDVVGAREGAIFAEDFGFGSFHGFNPNCLAVDRGVTRLSGMWAQAGSPSVAPARGRPAEPCLPRRVLRAPVAPCAGWHRARWRGRSSTMPRRRQEAPASPHADRRPAVQAPRPRGRHAEPAGSRRWSR